MSLFETTTLDCVFSGVKLIVTMLSEQRKQMDRIEKLLLEEADAKKKIKNP